MSQTKTLGKVYVAERLTRLKSVLSHSWQELAGDLGVTYQALYMIKSGKMPVSAKFERRLREAEAKAGIRAPGAATTIREVAERHGVKKETAAAFETFVRSLTAMPPEVQEAWAYREMFQMLREKYRKSAVAEQNLMESALRIVFPQQHGELMKWLNE